MFVQKILQVSVSDQPDWFYHPSTREAYQCFKSTHHNYVAKSAIPNRNQNEEDTVKCKLTNPTHHFHVIYYYSFSCVALHKMIEDDNNTEQFKKNYSNLPDHYQDLATHWLDLKTWTLLYRYGLN